MKAIDVLAEKRYKNPNAKPSDQIDVAMKAFAARFAYWTHKKGFRPYYGYWRKKNSPNRRWTIHQLISKFEREE